MYIYNFSDNNYELIIDCTDFIELKPVKQSNIWYKCILDDFFNKFTSNGKAINSKYMEIKPHYITKTSVPLEHNLEIEKKSALISKLQINWTGKLISEREYFRFRSEYYIRKSSLLEIQLLDTKLAYQNLVKDIKDIAEEISRSCKKP